MRSCFALLTVLCLDVSIASAGSISNCSPNGVGITCNIFETDAFGNPSEISNAFSLGTIVVPGYVVLLEGAGLDQTNVANWSDVLTFIDDGNGFASTAQLLSDGCNCFPNYNTVSMGGVQFIVETPPVTVYSPSGTDVYNIFSDETGESQIPEPGTLGFVGLSLLMVVFARTKFQIAAASAIASRARSGRLRAASLRPTPRSGCSTR